MGYLFGFIGASILFFAAYIFLSTSNYRSRFKQRYALRNHFPYELNYESRFSNNLLGNITLIISMGLSIAFYSFTASLKGHNGLLLFSLIAGIILSILVVVITFIPLKFLRTHMIFSILYFVAAFFFPASISLVAFRAYQETNSILTLVLFIILVVQAVFNFGLVMNPKLTFNIRMQVAKDEKGNEHYVRPNYIMMAFSEWLIMFTLFVSNVLLLILLTAL